MGLMYVFPVSEAEIDFVSKNDGELTLKTYGLPYIFWIYALCSIGLIFFMFIAIKEPVLKLVALGDETDSLLGYSLLSFIGSLPLLILAFFFYEKRIIKKGPRIKLFHRVFGLTVFSENFLLDQRDQFSVESFLSSPNVARMRGDESAAGFQNKGYFILWLTFKDGRRIQIDRHSRKADLDKLKLLLESH